ncbi:MAG: metal-dependent hydrolase [Candidatus Hodarchaeales archaeon]
MPYSHYFSALVIISILNTSSDYTTIFLIGAIAPDIDFAVTLFTKGNHRDLLTHSFFLWLILIIVGSITGFFQLTIFSTGALLHLLLDLVDWGLRPFQPFSKVKTTGFLTPKPEYITYKDFIKTYYRSKPVQIIDILLILSSVFFIFVI